MRAYWIPNEDAHICLCAEVPDGTVWVQLGPVPGLDAKITSINHQKKEYTLTWSNGYCEVLPIKANHRRVIDIKNWEIHRQGSTYTPGHERDHK